MLFPTRTESKPILKLNAASSLMVITAFIMLKFIIKKDQRDKQEHWFPTQIWERDHQNNQGLRKKFLLEIPAYGHEVIKKNSNVKKKF